MKSPPPWLQRPWLLFLPCCVLVLLAYWPGLSGPLLLDDFANLADVGAWLHGERSWQSAILNNRSGPLGRPVAMASFVLDAALFGDHLWYAKLTSLLLHLACGAALLGLLRRLLARDPRLSAHARWLPLYLVLLWLALPINVSSVLYLVQRMAILSALFALLALWLYVDAREALERGERRGALQLWLGVPALTLLAVLSKENGALVPLLALALELAYFAPAPGQRRPAAVRAFFALAVAAPVALACIGFALRPARLLGGYAGRDFSFVERVLSEPRILWDYVASLLVPYGPRLGIFHDDYAKSTGLLTPWTTLPALLAWGAALALAWRARRAHPAILAGLLLYLGGHAMESTVIPLELYFEHRNYLPGIGVLLAAAGLVAAIGTRLRTPTPAFRAAVLVAATLLPLAYLATTHGRARVWSSLDTLYAQELRYNPDSPRLRSFLAGRAMDAGDLPAALEHIAVAERHSPPGEAVTASLWRLLAHCAGKRTPADALYREFDARARGPISMYAMVGWEQLAQKVEQGECPGLDVSRLTGIGQAWLARDPQPPTSHAVWRTRYYLARLLAYQSRFDEAIAQADRAWRDSNFNNGIGVFLFQVNASEGNTAACARVLARLQAATGQGDHALDRTVQAFRDALDAGSIGR